MSLIQKLADMQRLLIPSKNKFVFFEGKSRFQHLSVIYYPDTNFLGMFSNGKFMGGHNTKTHFPWNSPFFLIDFYVKKPSSALFLGGGPCSAPVALWKRDRRVSIDIVEQDKLTIDLAHKYFGLRHSRRISINVGSAQRFISVCNQKYDVIYFNIGFTYERRDNPAYLFFRQKSAIMQLSRLLNKRGVLVFVVIAKNVGQQSKFLSGVFSMFRQHFKHVDVYSDHPSDGNREQSHIFISSRQSCSVKSAIKKLSKLKNNWGSTYRELSAKQTPVNYLVLSKTYT